ncbi:hypothetical protein SKAU_G00102380 [Synaphobranchus kaupii]|uniref:Uncharacterized protein n=1 Tax=Synaphobranchus kaupii TaxID=118154 RepID=A0A9Q1FZQ4_SYNKA|nr:hypothetical protein SKAU_G00102380 [Synaphobranchus kaupii]
MTPLRPRLSRPGDPVTPGVWQLSVRPQPASEPRDTEEGLSCRLVSASHLVLRPQSDGLSVPLSLALQRWLRVTRSPLARMCRNSPVRRPTTPTFPCPQSKTHYSAMSALPSSRRNPEFFLHTTPGADALII